MTKSALVTTNDPKLSRFFIKLTIHVDVPPEAVKLNTESSSRKDPGRPETDRSQGLPDNSAAKARNMPH